MVEEYSLRILDVDHGKRQQSSSWKAEESVKSSDYCVLSWGFASGAKIM